MLKINILLSLCNTFAQNLLMASGGNPLLRRAVRVNRRGSSQSLQHTHTHTYVLSIWLLWLPFESCPPDKPGSNELLYLALGDNSVVEIESAVLPLHRAVDIQDVAEPVVGRAPAGQNTILEATSSQDQICLNFAVK